MVAPRFQNLNVSSKNDPTKAFRPVNHPYLSAAGLSDTVFFDMKRVLVAVALGLAVLTGLLIVSAPLIKQLIKNRIASELRSFIREGSLDVENISMSPKRREARLEGLRIRDRAGRQVAYVRKIDIQVRRIHHRHVDASMRVYEPLIGIQADTPDLLLNLLRWEAFEEESPYEFDRIDIQGGRLAVSAPGILASAETIPFEAKTHVGDHSREIEFQAAGARTAIQARIRMDAENGVRRILDGTRFELSTDNLALTLPRRTGAAGVLRVRAVPSDTEPSTPKDLAWNVDLDWGSLSGRLTGIRPSADTPGAVESKEIRITAGPEELLCLENFVEGGPDSLRLKSAKWIRRKTGLALTRVRVSATQKNSVAQAALDGRPVSGTIDWSGPLRLAVSAESIPISLMLREIAETLPVSGSISVRGEAARVDSPPNAFSWRADVSSADLRVGPEFGRLVVRADLELSGVDTRIDKLAGIVEPAPAIPIRLTGKSTARGFAGRASMRDRSLEEIQLLGEAFGREIPLIGESGRAGLDVDFFVRPNLEFTMRGRVRIQDATVMSKGFPFRVEGFEADVPFEVTPDTGKLVLAEAAVGRAEARSMVIGPYRFENFSVTTSSKGDKVFTEFSPIDAFGGKIRAKVLFHFSDRPHQHAELSVDSLSLRQLLAPFEEGRDALTGLIHGEAKVHTQGGDLKTARGILWAKAGDGPGEPMRVSRKLLEELGGDVIRKVNLPKHVPYRDGFLKVRLLEGRILFDETSLEAQTMLRKIRIGKVAGSYMLTDLIDVLSNVSTEKVKWNIGGRKRK